MAYPIGHFVVDEDGESGIIVDRTDYSDYPLYHIRWFNRPNDRFSTQFIKGFIARYWELERFSGLRSG